MFIGLSISLAYNLKHIHGDTYFIYPRELVLVTVAHSDDAMIK